MSLSAHPEAPRLLPVQLRGQAIHADMAGPLAERYSCYQGLVQRVLQLDLQDAQAAEALVADVLAAVGAAGGQPVQPVAPAGAGVGTGEQEQARRYSGA